MERAMQVCLKDFQDTVVPLRIKMYLLVDFDVSKSAIQFASLTLQVQVDTSHIPRHTLWYFSSSPLLVVGQSNSVTKITSVPAQFAYSVSYIGSSAIH